MQINNDVECQLASAVSVGATSITVTDPPAPFNLPATPDADPSIATLIDSMLAPTQIEIVTYTGLTDNGDGTHTLTGVTRAQENTVDQTFENGYLIQAPTAGIVAWLLDRIAAKANSADLATVATTGDYGDLLNTPDLSVFDDVLAYADQASFPATGETGKVYIANDTGYLYRWNGSSYTQLTDQTAIWDQITGDQSQVDLGGFNVDAGFLGISPTWTGQHTFPTVTINQDGSEVALPIESNHWELGYLRRITNNAGGPVFSLGKARGTLESPAAVQVGDICFSFNAEAHNGSGFISPVAIRAYVESVSGTDVTVSLRFFTTDAAGSFAERFRIDEEGKLTISEGDVDAGSGKLANTAGTAFTPHALTDVTATGQTRTVDVANGPVQTIGCDQGFTLAFTGPSGKLAEVTVYIRNDHSTTPATLTAGSGIIGTLPPIDPAETGILLFAWDGIRSRLIDSHRSGGDLRPT